jgi:transcription antitermination factor NusG
MKPNRDNTKAADWYRDEPWLIVRTQPQRETTLAAHCVARGIPAFNPQVKVEKPRLTSAGKRTSATRTRMQPLFRGYIFVSDTGLRHARIVRGLPGFLDWLHTAGPNSHVASVAPEAIAALGEQEFNLSTVREKRFTPFSVGQAVRFADGPFEGLLAKIIAIDPSKRISVLRELFGRETIVKVHANEIEAA